MSRTVILPIKLKEDDVEELHRVAEEKGINTSQLVRSLLVIYMKDRSEKFSGEIVNGRPTKERRVAN